jgi:phosphate transport system protein
MNKGNLTDHISRRYNEDIEHVRKSVLEMGGIVERQIEGALAALIEGDSEAALRIAQDDYKVNRLEVAVDEECTRILALRAPAAVDLRVIIAIIKTITDLERMGDEAEKIAVLASHLAAQERPGSNYREIRHLGEHVRKMVRSCLDAFARLDTEAAVQTKLDDQVVDQEYEAISRQSITFMMEDPRTIRRVLDVMWIVRSLERIGDHAKNICEYVIYMVHGKDVRHTSIEDMLQEAGQGDKGA